MASWSLPDLLATLHTDIERRLDAVRRVLAHPDSKGDASERVWIEMLNRYLPKRYEVSNAFVVDSEGVFSEQIDVVVFDRQYSPFILSYEGQTVIPAESVYACFEAKQAINAAHVEYAQMKVASVRRLLRTSLPIPHAGGTFPAKVPMPILGGILAFQSDWSPPFGAPLIDALKCTPSDRRLDLGCVAATGHFFLKPDHDEYEFLTDTKPATAFLFKLISELQNRGTVSMIDIDAYARWLA
jgi:hypothetical protein